MSTARGTIVGVALGFLYLIPGARADVSGTGAYQTDVSFDVPAYYGLEPKVGMSYSSAAGNGPAGIGWRLTAGSTIRRQSSTYGAPRYDATDIFFVDGRELVDCAAAMTSVSCDPWGAAGTHAFRIDTFQRVVFDRSANTWTITDRDGTTHTYVAALGDTGDSQRTFTWTLQRDEDPAGHRVYYDYDCSGGSCYLRTISYGDGFGCESTPGDVGPGQPVPGARIEFAWEPRTDAYSIGTGLDSFPFEEVHDRLHEVKVSHMREVVRAYELDYTPASGTQSSLLQQIRELGSDLHSEAPRRTFTSPAMTTSMTPTATALAPTGGFLLGPVVGSGSQLFLPTWMGTGAFVTAHHSWWTAYRNHVFADVDGDGRADLVQWDLTTDYATMQVFTRSAGTTTDVASFLDWGHAPFQDGSGCTGIGGPACIPATNGRAVDLDGDGLQDLMFENWVATGNTLPGNAEMMLELVTMRSRGDGTFDPADVETTAIRRWAVEAVHPVCTAADVNGDRHVDFLCKSMTSTSEKIVTELGTGTGDFREVSEASPAVLSMMDADLVVADINADGRADPIFLVSSTAMAGQPTTNCYQGNDGVTYCPHWELTVGIARDDGVYDWETQVTTVLSSIFQLQHSVLAGDLDGDGRDDLVIVQQAQSGSKVTSVRNVGTGSMRWSLTGQNITGLTDQSVLALGDTDTDGIAELLVAYPHVNNNTYCGDAGVSGHYEVGSALPMQADNTFFTATNIDENFQCGRSLFAWPELAEVNGDGRTDWIGLVDGGPSTYMVQDQTAIHRNASKRAWRRADVNGDGREDWVAVIYGNPGLEVYTAITQPNGSFAWSNVMFAPSSSEAASPDAVRNWVAADVGGPSGVADGMTDLVVVDDATGIVTTFLSQGNGMFSRPTPVNHGLTTRRSPQPWLPLDANGDGRTDLIRLERTTVPNGTGTWPAVAVRVLLSDGSGGWSAVSSTVFVGTETPRLSAFRPIDLDGDARGDLVQIATTLSAGSAGMTTEIRTLRSQGDGTYVDAIQLVTQPHVDAEHYAVADINGDGRGDLARLDFLPAGAGGPTVAWLAGIGNGRFVGPAIVGTTGTMQAVTREFRGFTAADVDEDGRTDFYNVMVERDAMGAVTTTLQTVWNRVTGFAGEPTAGLAPSATDVGAFQLDDFDSDGRPDLVRLGETIDRIKLGAPTTRMTEHTNGMGGKTAIVYTTSVGQTANLPAGMVLPLVAQTSDTDTFTNLVVEATTYGYQGILFDHGRHQLLGIARVDATTGRTKTSSQYQLDDHCGARVRINELGDTAGAVIARTSYNFVADSSTGQAPFTCLVADETDEQCEGTSTCRTTIDHTWYDVFGNAQEVWEEGDLADATDDRVTFSPVSANLAAWIVASPAYKITYGQADYGGGWYWWAFEYTEYGYDGQVAWNAPTVGALTLERRWNDQTGGYADTTIDYDKWGNVSRRTGPATPHAPTGQSETVDYECTFHRFPERTCDAIGCASIGWDLGTGLRTETVDMNGESTATHYDPLGRLIEVDQPDGSVLSWDQPDWTAPSAAQKVRAKVTDGSPNDGVYWIDTFLDGLGRAWRTTEEGGRSTDVEFDGASDRELRRSNPYLVGQPVLWTQHTYDAANRNLATTMPDGRTRRNIYRVGRVTMIDELQGSRDAFTDAYGRVVAIQEWLRKCFNGGDICPIDATYLTTYGWDPLDRQTWIRDTDGHLTTSRYDSLSNRLEACTPDRGCEQTTYADDGLPLVATDANGDVHQIDYDMAGRERRHTTFEPGGWVSRSVEYAWDLDPSTGMPIGDSIGRLVRIDDNSRVNVSRVRGYDPMGRVNSAQDCVLWQCATTAYDYDQAGRIDTITYPDGSTADHVYDSRGLLAAIPGYAFFLYDDATYRPTTTLYNNGVIETHAYDPARLWTDEIDLGAKNGTFTEVVTHDPKGRVVHTESFRTGSSLAMTYSYDDLDRVRQVTSSDPALDAIYVYNGIGNKIVDSNRGSIDYADPAHVHAPTATGSGQSFVYDALGQLVRSDRRAITWNADGNPISIIDRWTGADTEYAYDGEGQRVARASAMGVDLSFGPLADMDARGNWVMYVMAHGQAIAQVDANGTTFVHRDHLGSVRAVTDVAGRLLDERDYGTWGDVRTPFAFPAVTEAFAGLRRDDEQGLIQLGARSYDPDSATFLSSDSIVPDLFVPQSLNAYAYALNNPASLIDPTGHSYDDPEFYYDEEMGVWGLDLTSGVGEVQSQEPLEPDGTGVEVTEPTDIGDPVAPDEGFWKSIVSGNSEPSFGKSLIPFVGSGQSMIYHFKHENYVRGVFYTAMTISDVFMVSAIVKGAVVKVGIKGGAAALASDFARGAKLMVTGRWRAFGETWRLLTGKAKYGLKELVWNPRDYDKVVSPQYWRGLANGLTNQHLWFMNSSRWVPLGLRSAGFNLLEVPRAFNTWMGTGMSNVVFRLGIATLLKADGYATYDGTQSVLGKEPGASPPKNQENNK